MADDTSLLFRIRGDASGAKTAVNDTRQAVSQLKASATSDLKAIQTASQSSLGSITQSAGQITQSIPGVGRAVNSLSNAFTSLTAATGSASTGLAAMAGPLSIAVAGFVATTAAVVSLGNALFGLAKQTADFQGKLQDLSQQTGVSVETLSALEIVAATTGGSIESVTASLGIFQKNLEEASTTADSKAAKAFERLGVQVTDTEQTFRDTLAALAKMPEGFRQTSLALELFGRGGKQVLAILKETQGDLDGTIEKLRGLGLVTTEQARRADEFNDRLALLGFSLRGLGSEIIPLVSDAIKDLQKTIEDNKEAVDFLKIALQGIAALFVGPLKGAIFAGNEAIKSHKTEIGLLTEAYQILRTAIAGAAAEIPKQPLISSADKNGLELLREVFTLLKTQQPLTQKQDFSKVPGLFKEGARTAGVDAGTQMLIQLQRELRGLEDATRAEEVAAELLDKRFKGVNATVKEQILLVARTIDRKREQLEVDRETKELAERQEKDRLDAIEDLDRFLRQQVETLREVQGVTKDAFDEVEDFITAQQLLGRTLDENQQFWLRFNASMTESAKRLRDLTNLPMPELVAVGEATGPLDILPGEEPPEQPIQNLNEAINELGTTMANVFGAGKEAGQDFANIMKGAIGDLAFGVASLVENWVLVGETGPAAMRKLTASVLAGVAAQAAVKAIFELAEGFAALFFNPAAAAAHFKAAALFGSVAGVAAVAGRSVAGDLFKPTGGGAGQGATGGGGTGQLNPLTLNRNQPQTQRIIVEFRADDSKFGQAITAHIIQDGQTAGPIRQFQADDGSF